MANPTSIDLPPLSFRAELGTVNVEARTVDVIFTTGAPVVRFDWMGGTRYIETLSMDPKHVRLDRLNSGAPLLDTHSGYSLSDQIGVVEEDTAKMSGGRGLATVRLSKRDAVEPIWRDIQDRIIQKLSVGYIVHKYEETTGKDGSIKTRKAIDWEPYELSFVPMPADTGAQTRDGAAAIRTHPCLITRGVEPPDAPQERAMENQQSETIAEQNPLTPPAAPTERTVPAEPTDADLARTAERERVIGITTAGRITRMSGEFIDRLMSEGVPLVKSQAMMLEEMRKRGGDAVGGPQLRREPSVEVDGGHLVHIRAGIENAILNRAAPTYFPLEDKGRNYRGMSLLDIARAYLNARGVRTTSMGKMELASVALGLDQRAGYHTTSDFGDLLGDVVSKTLLKAFEAAPQTFGPISRQITVPDFKDIGLLQLGEAPALKEVTEHSEFTRGSIGTSGERFRLKTYGRIFAITRQAIVNDDMDAFSRVPMLFGRAARNLESDTNLGEIIANPIMADTFALFSVDHHNIDDVGDTINIMALSIARTAIRLQTGVSGDETKLGLTPKYLIVPPSLETVAQQAVAVVMATLPGQVNPFQGSLTVITEPRLEDDSSISWYVAAGSDQIDTIVYAYLEGQTGPTIDRRVGFDIDGLEIKARHDFAAKAVDYRGIYKNVGEEPS